MSLQIPNKSSSQAAKADYPYSILAVAECMFIVKQKDGGIGAIQLNRVTHHTGSAWDKVSPKNHTFISDDDMANYHTFNNVTV